MSTTAIGGIDFWGFTALKRVVSEAALAALFIATFVEYTIASHCSVYKYDTKERSAFL
jgi:hypothetical protein